MHFGGFATALKAGTNQENVFKVLWNGRFPRATISISTPGGNARNGSQGPDNFTKVMIPDPHNHLLRRVRETNRWCIPSIRVT